MGRIVSISGNAAFRLTDQQVHVLGHDHVSDNREVISPTHLFQHVQEQIAVASAPQQRQALVATGGDEVLVSRAVVTMQPFGMDAV